MNNFWLKKKHHYIEKWIHSDETILFVLLFSISVEEEKCIFCFLPLLLFLLCVWYYDGVNHAHTFEFHLFFPFTDKPFFVHSFCSCVTFFGCTAFSLRSTVVYVARVRSSVFFYYWINNKRIFFYLKNYFVQNINNKNNQYNWREKQQKKQKFVRLTFKFVKLCEFFSGRFVVIVNSVESNLVLLFFSWFAFWFVIVWRSHALWFAPVRVYMWVRCPKSDVLN